MLLIVNSECMITDIILCAENISTWSRPKTAPEDHVKNGELARNNTSTRHQPHSPVHRNKERLKDTEVLTNILFYVIFILFYYFYIDAA